jgi:hypothetical protein
MTSDEVSEAAKLLARDLHKRLMPVLFHFIDEATREGHTETVINLALAAEALVIASSAHTGSEELFMRMAQAALEQERASGDASVH